jgi:hypothetical protein
LSFGDFGACPTQLIHVGNFEPIQRRNIRPTLRTPITYFYPACYNTGA